MRTSEHHSRLCFALAVFALAFAASPARAQVMGGQWAADYSIANIGSAPGVPGFYGGAVFARGDATRLLLGGNANTSIGGVYSVKVQRDALGHVVGFAGSATRLADAPFIDGGLAYAPNGVLLYTAFPINVLGQIRPGANAPSKTTLLSGLGVGGSVGGCGVVQLASGGALRLKLTAPGISRWYDAPMANDGTGTYDIGLVTPHGPVVPSAGAMAYVSAGEPGFAAAAALVTSCNGFVGAYSLDANGDIVASLGSFVLSLAGCADGMTVDPLTGDLLIATWDLKRIYVVRGFESTARYCSSASGAGSCPPRVDWSGSPTLSGPDDFVVRATQAPAGQNGFEIWSLAPTQSPYAGAFLCVAQPIRRIPIPSAPGGTGSCPGVLAHSWTHAFFADKGLAAGSTVYTQFAVRNPGAQPPFILSDAVRFTVAP